MGRNEQRLGYWTEHPGEYRKRTIPEGQTFCGWDILGNQVTIARHSDLELGFVLGGLVSALFETGGRATEVLGLRESQFKLPESLSISDKPEVHIADMVVLKKHRRIELSPDWARVIYENGLPTRDYYHYYNEPVLTYRQVSFPAIEPLSIPLIEYVKLVRDRSELLPDRVRNNENGLLFPFKYDWLYKHITKLFGGTKEERINNQGWWPHRYRAERATQLVVEYDFDTYRLLRFFGWSSAEITLRYVRLSTRDVLDRMWVGLM